MRRAWAAPPASTSVPSDQHLLSPDPLRRKCAKSQRSLKDFHWLRRSKKYIQFCSDDGRGRKVGTLGGTPVTFAEQVLCTKRSSTCLISLDPHDNPTRLLDPVYHRRKTTVFRSISHCRWPRCKAGSVGWQSLPPYFSTILWSRSYLQCYSEAGDPHGSVFPI